MSAIHPTAPSSGGRDVKPSCGDQWTIKQYEEVINSFLREISFTPPHGGPDLDLVSAVRNRMESQGVSPATLAVVRQCIETGARISSKTYSYLSPAMQEIIATYAAYVISIDDLTAEITSDLESYTAALMCGKMQRHTLLQGFTNHLSDQCEIFGPFGGDMIVKGSLEFLSSAVVETRETEPMFLPEGASDYLVYFRAKTGVAEPFAFFCFPEDVYPEATCLETYSKAIPSIMLILGYVNDVFSFYKEEASPGDAAGFIRSYSKFYNISLIQSLRRITNETLRVVQQLRDICVGHGRLSEHMERFVQGYIWYHLTSSRYKLSELDILTLQVKRH
ncbi:hypothetical protein JDV02_010724 [Purpureocillium takamizusanense]|uniref:Terpenoid synthase n=1 Tax=Purpureocillium takamizusanense TaxID=2060973 RepID=A0A9Q8QTI6_9HYPO|nr:uncharacterized protein JDV02_010724 [Purpureocillium takamizusanense]UNI25016.1 hypothetical protein JDV02_010724 [Purpureocillium takamizusanense]